MKPERLAAIRENQRHLEKQAADGEWMSVDYLATRHLLAYVGELEAALEASRADRAKCMDGWRTAEREIDRLTGERDEARAGVNSAVEAWLNHDKGCDCELCKLYDTWRAASPGEPARACEVSGCDIAFAHTHPARCNCPVAHSPYCLVKTPPGETARQEKP